MAKIAVLGAGISGHTAALELRRKLPREHEVIVVSPDPRYNWIPSNIWVGVGIMSPEEVTFELEPVYERLGIRFHQGRAVELHPEGGAEGSSPHVIYESTEESRRGTRGRIDCDFIVNATGPKFNYAATPGLGPDQGHTHSVCTYRHAAETGRRFRECLERLEKGERQTFLIGMGHGMCTCEGAAFEYTFNVEFELNRHGVRDRARVIYLTNEFVLGDFGVGGLHIRRGGYVVSSRTFAESLFVERGVEWIAGAHVRQVERGRAEYELLSGELGSVDFDFAMLLPPFAGVGLKVFDRAGKDVSAEVQVPSGLMKVDADYEGRPVEHWKATDWPRTYETRYSNLYSIGIAFAPPHAISVPRKSPSGTVISPSPPRTGQPSAIMGKTVAWSIRDRILHGAKTSRYTASLGEMGAACVASAGANVLSGTAASMTMYPVVPDRERFPEYGRDLRYTFGEIGSAGHWIKRLLHHLFMYKAKARPLWWLIPE